MIRLYPIVDEFVNVFENCEKVFREIALQSRLKEQLDFIVKRFPNSLLDEFKKVLNERNDIVLEENIFHYDNAWSKEKVDCIVLSEFVCLSKDGLDIFQDYLLMVSDYWIGIDENFNIQVVSIANDAKIV